MSPFSRKKVYGSETLELSRREHKAFTMISKDNDERNAIERSARMTCWAAA